MSRRHSSLSKEKALFAAVGAGNFDKVYDLLSNGVNKNATNEEGKSALYVSVEKGNVDLVRLLIHAGADPLIEDKEGKRAVECLETATMSNKVRERICECLTGNKQKKKNPSHPVNEEESKLTPDDLSMEEAVDNFTSRLSEAARPFLCALYRNPGTARAVLRAPTGASTVENKIPGTVPDTSDTSASAPTANPPIVHQTTTETDTTGNTEPAIATPLGSDPVPDDVATATHATEFNNQPNNQSSNQSTSSVAAENWLSPVLRSKGMSDPRIVQDVCELVIGKFEYTDEGFASMPEGNFETIFAPHITVPGRLATLQCAHRHIHRVYREFEDNMQGLTMNSVTGASTASSGLLQTPQPRQGAPAPLVASTQLANITPVHAFTTTTVNFTAAGNVIANTPTSTSTMTTTVSAPAAAVSSTVNASSVPSTPRHACTLDCTCPNIILTAGRKRSRDMTPTRVTPLDPNTPAVAVDLASPPPMAPMAPLPLAGTHSSPSVKRRSFSPSRRAVIVPEPGKNYTGQVLAHLREKNARRALHQQM